MVITAEISYYPLADKYAQAVKEFIACIKDEEIEAETSVMSTLLTGEYDKVMKVLNSGMASAFKKHPSVFIVKISNACRTGTNK